MDYGNLKSTLKTKNAIINEFSYDELWVESLERHIADLTILITQHFNNYNKVPSIFLIRPILDPYGRNKKIISFVFWFK